MDLVVRNSFVKLLNATNCECVHHSDDPFFQEFDRLQAIFSVAG